METKANYAAVGLFVVVLLMSGLGFLFWLTNAGERARQMDVRIVFSDSVSGLYQGSAVLFNGIKVGEVSTLSLDPEDPSKVIAIAKVDRSVPLKADTRAKQSQQGLTGVSNVSLEGGSKGSPTLLSVTKAGEMPTIPAEVSPFSDIVESSRRVLNRADSAMEAVDRLINDNKAAISRSVASVDVFTTALASNSAGIGDLVANVGSASKAVGKIAATLDSSSHQLDAILAAVDPQKVKDILGNAAHAVAQADAAAARINTLAGSVDPAQVKSMLADLAAASAKAGEVTASLQAALAPVSPQAVAEITANVRSSAADIAAFSQGIRAKTADVQGILDEAHALVATLKIVSDKVNYFAEKANGLIDDKGGPGIVQQAQDALKAVKELAQTLNQKAGPITDNLDRFSSAGLANFNQLATDARRTLDIINRLVTDIERNPQQFIFGAAQAPGYNARR